MGGERERERERATKQGWEDSQFTGGGEVELTCLIPRAPRPASSGPLS